LNRQVTCSNFSSRFEPPRTPRSPRKASKTEPTVKAPETISGPISSILGVLGALGGSILFVFFLDILGGSHWFPIVR
jgi:hypothetical protein